MAANLHDVWTDAREKQLATLWAAGKSCSKIAAELGCFGHCRDGGRSAVIGKIHRLKLPPRNPPGSAPNMKPKRKPGPKPGKIVSISRMFGQVRSEPRRNQSNSIAAKLAIVEAEPGLPENLKGDEPDGTGVKFINLQAGQCKWPRGTPGNPDFEFCGCKALPDLPYCPGHTRRAIAPTQSRNRMERAIASI